MSDKVHDTASTQPVKKFFVSMLTRDINLADAILDLVDNCLDGALRSVGSGDVNYSQHHVKIKLTSELFEIADNCGGIPRTLAKNYAFKMGRDPDDTHDLGNETIGIYGVGMKRAIFKMGREARVRTLHGDDGFEVPITSSWLDNKEWDELQIINMEGTDRLQEAGTVIEVRDLHSTVSRQFDNRSFINKLHISIAEHFTVFLQKGLSIFVNDNKIDPVRIEVLVSENSNDPAPYVFQKTIDDVTVSLAIGLNTGRDVLYEGNQAPQFERERLEATAGWSVFCNDRAVIVGDKSHLTGWGNAKIPRYHYQFSIITGIIEFKSKCVSKLPVTTTKRALDVSSDIWLEALTKMKEGMKIWTNYTNSWKNYPRLEQTQYWTTAKPCSLHDAIKVVLKRDSRSKTRDYIEFNPKKFGCPSNSTGPRIAFSLSTNQISSSDRRN